MTNAWTLGRRLAVSFGIAGATLLLVAVMALWASDGLIANNKSVTHIYSVRGTLTTLRAQIQAVETSTRGFVITGSDEFLAPSEVARRQIPETLDRLRQLTSDDPDQQHRLAQLSPLIQQKLAIAAYDATLRREQGAEAAARAVQSEKGKDTMEQIRALLLQADQAEAALLDRRTAATEEFAQRAMSIIVIGGIVGALIVAVICFLTVRALSGGIGRAVGHIQSSSSELHAAANQQGTSIKEQVAAMNEISTTISELLATSHQIAESAQRVAHIAEQTTDAARSGDGAVEMASDAIGAIRRQMDTIVNQNLQLGQKSQQIGSILDVVTELAEQTNILSINATIEAAGAAEGGKRFAAVADEIRNLADRVSGSTKEIRQLIDEVRASVNATIMTTEAGSKAVDGGARQFSQVAQVFENISSVAATAAEAAREIELSTKQQASAVEQVNVAMANIAQAARETETGAGQTIQTASELATTSLGLMRLVRAGSA